MSYVDRHLLNGEKVLFRTCPSWVVGIPAILLLLVAIAVYLYLPVVRELAYVMAAASLFYALYAWVTVCFAEFVVTDKRIIAKRGVISITTVGLVLKKVESVDLYQTLFGRIFNYGSVTIVGTGGTKDRFDNISGPSEFRNIIQEVIHDISS